MINSICQSTTVRQPKGVSATILKYCWSLDNSNTLPQTNDNIEIGHILMKNWPVVMTWPIVEVDGISRCSGLPQSSVHPNT